MSSDVFRPRLPKDPFHDPYSQQPEHIHPDSPWPTYHFSAKSAVFSVQPHVLLVLGAPSAHALAPILRSPTFARSLLLLVTHNPPPLSALTHARPTITILRLDGPLLPAAPAFALTLVQVLDAAAAVARAWSGSPHDIQQLAQDPAGAFTVREPLTPDSLPISVSHHHRPARRTSRLADPPPPPPPPNPPLSPVRRPTPNRASSSLSLTKLPLPKRPASTPTSASALRPFDAILSFLPPLQPERAVLKQVVLTTTLAAPFLAGSTRSASASAFDLRSPAYSAYAYGYGYESRPGSIASSESAPRRRSRFSSLFGTGTNTGTRSVPATRPSSASISASSGYTFTNNTNTHDDEGAAAYIIHVLPTSYRSAKLEGALGAFVASASVNSNSTRGYVLAERALRDLECLLVGALHSDGAVSKEEEEEGRRGAWVAGVLNVVTPTGASAAGGGGEAVEVDAVDVEAQPGEEYGKKEKEKNPPFGLPTPPASRHGSREGAGEEELVSSGALEEGRQPRQREGGRRKASVSLPSSSSHHPHPHPHPHPQPHHPHPQPHHPHPQPHPHPTSSSSSAPPRAHARNPSLSSGGGSGQGKLRRASGRRPAAAEGAMRRADSAPAPTASSHPHPSPAPALPSGGSGGVPQTRKSGRRRDNLKTKDGERERGKFFGGKGPGDFSLRAATTLPMSASGERRRWWALWS